MSDLHLPIAAKMIHLRELPVLLDRDLAVFYGVETRVLKQAVRRNRARFPSDFMFVLDPKEVETMVSQNVIPSLSVFGCALPFVFTEQGVTMLSTVLRTATAIEISVRVVRAFVALRQHALNYAALASALSQLEASTDARFAEVGQLLDALMQQKQQQEDFAQRTRIGFRSNKKAQGR